IPTGRQVGFDKPIVTAQSSEFYRKTGLRTLGRIKEMIATVITNIRADTAGQRSTLFIFNRLARGRVDAVDFFPGQLIADAATQVIPHRRRRITRQFIRPFVQIGFRSAKEGKSKILQRIAGIHTKSESSLVEITIFSLRVEPLQPEGSLRVAKVRIVEADTEVLARRTDGKIPIYPLPATQQIFFRDARIEYESVSTAVACANRKVSSGAFLNVHQQIYGIGLIGLLGRELYILEISRSLQGLSALS